MIEIRLLCMSDEDVFYKRFPLRASNNKLALSEDDGGGYIVKMGENEVPALSKTVSEFIFYDLRYFELKKLETMLPYFLQGSTPVIASAFERTNNKEDLLYIQKIVSDHIESLGESNIINIDGILIFKLKAVMESWAEAVCEAADECRAGEDCTELLQLLDIVSFQKAEKQSGGSARLVLFQDGSCLLTSDSGVRIECSEVNNTLVLSLLASISPRWIDLYDMTANGAHELFLGILNVFRSRVRLFRLIDK